MSILQKDAPVFNSVLPAIGKSYTMPQMVARNESYTYAPPTPKKWVKKLFEDYTNGTPANFYDTYFPQLQLGGAEQEKILLAADSILKGVPPECFISPVDTCLVGAEAIRLAYNADVYGHNMFKKACFLNEQNQLPKECQILFERNINPSLYEEKELFTKVEESLSKFSPKILDQWKQRSFQKWLRTGNSEKYVQHMTRMRDVEDLLDYAMENTVGYVGWVKEQELAQQNCTRSSGRRNWRGGRV